MNLSGHLPGELIEAIIGYLPDRQSIKPCSLISRAWVPWTRVHLFSQVRLVLKNLLPFLLLLQSPYCTFPCYVHCIYIEAFLDAMSSSYRKVLLDVFNGRHAWLDQRNTTGKSSIFHELHTSTVNTVGWSTPSHVINLICLFPAIKHLRVHLWAFMSGVGICNGLPPVSRTLKSLTITTGVYASTQSCQWRNLIQWVHRHQLFEISKLYLDVMAPWNTEGAEALLKIQTSSLRHLHIGPVLSCMSFSSF
jgi:hypothetical protein